MHSPMCRHGRRSACRGALYIVRCPPPPFDPCRYIAVSRSLLLKEICLAIKKGFPNSGFEPPFLTPPKWLLWLLGPLLGLSRDFVT